MFLSVISDPSWPVTEIPSVTRINNRQLAFLKKSSEPSHSISLTHRSHIYLRNLIYRHDHLMQDHFQKYVQIHTFINSHIRTNSKGSNVNVKSLFFRCCRNGMMA